MVRLIGPTFIAQSERILGHMKVRTKLRPNCDYILIFPFAGFLSCVLLSEYIVEIVLRKLSPTPQPRTLPIHLSPFISLFFSFSSVLRLSSSPSRSLCRHPQVEYRTASWEATLAHLDTRDAAEIVAKADRKAIKNKFAVCVPEGPTDYHDHFLSI